MGVLSVQLCLLKFEGSFSVWGSPPEKCVQFGGPHSFSDRLGGGTRKTCSVWGGVVLGFAVWGSPTFFTVFRAVQFGGPREKMCQIGGTL